MKRLILAALFGTTLTSAAKAGLFLLAASSPFGPTVPNQTIDFGALTLGGAGAASPVLTGFAATGCSIDATSIAAGWQVTNDALCKLSKTTNNVSSIVIVLTASNAGGSSAPGNITINPLANTYSVVPDPAATGTETELKAALTAITSAGGKTVAFRPGTEVMPRDTQTLNSRAYASQVVIKSHDNTLTGLTLETGGSGYAVNDTITLGGGTFSAATVLTVNSVSAGKVLTFSITTPGTYSEDNGHYWQGSTSGAGTGATFFMPVYANRVKFTNVAGVAFTQFKAFKNIKFYQVDFPLTWTGTGNPSGNTVGVDLITSVDGLVFDDVTISSSSLVAADHVPTPGSEATTAGDFYYYNAGYNGLIGCGTVEELTGGGLTVRNSVLHDGGKGIQMCPNTTGAPVIIEGNDIYNIREDFMSFGWTTNLIVRWNDEYFPYSFCYDLTAINIKSYGAGWSCDPTHGDMNQITNASTDSSVTGLYVYGNRMLASRPNIPDYLKTIIQGPFYEIGSSSTIATNGTTAAGDPTLHFASTAGVVVGMTIVDSTAGTVIPAGTTVLSLTSTTVTMSANATGAGVGSPNSIVFTTSSLRITGNFFGNIYVGDTAAGTEVDGGLNSNIENNTYAISQVFTTGNHYISGLRPGAIITNKFEAGSGNVLINNVGAVAAASVNGGDTITPNVLSSAFTDYPNDFVGDGSGTWLPTNIQEVMTMFAPKAGGRLDTSSPKTGAIGSSCVDFNARTVGATCAALAPP